MPDPDEQEIAGTDADLLTFRAALRLLSAPRRSAAPHGSLSRSWPYRVRNSASVIGGKPPGWLDLAACESIQSASRRRHPHVIVRRG